MTLSDTYLENAHIPPMHVAIFGGTGFVGTAVRRELCSRSLQFTTASRSPRRRDNHVQVDVADRAAVKALVRQVDVVVNLVAASPLLPAGNNARYIHCHLRGAASVLEAVREYGSRLIHVGAMGVSESSCAGYAWTKARAERLVRESSADALVLSPGILFGDGSELISMLASLARLPVAPVPRIENRFQPLFVDDLAALIADAIERVESVAPHGCRQVEVGGPDVMSGTAFAERYCRAGGTPTLFVPATAVTVAIRAASWLRLPFFPVDLPRMLAMENSATGRHPLVKATTRYDDWLGNRRP